MKGRHPKNEFKKGQVFTEEQKRKISEGIKNAYKSGKMKCWCKGKKGVKTSNKGGIAWNKGKKFPQFSEGNSYQWKGDSAGYVAIHIWVRKWKGKPNICEICGIETAKRYEWANIDHKYRRVLEDYIRACKSCHKKYDNANKKGKIG